MALKPTNRLERIEKAKTKRKKRATRFVSERLDGLEVFDSSGKEIKLAKESIS